MKAEPGTYALIMHSRSSASTQVGRWGILTVKPGYYIYVGSAFGPGGLHARVSRHCRKTKPKHWHIDYLRQHVHPVGVWYSYEPIHLEHQWAKALSEMAGMSPIENFGCSDCKCYSHLFTTHTTPDFHRFSNAADCKVESWSFPETA